MELKDCLPLDLQGQTTTIIPIAAGLSGAGVFWVEAAGQAFVLKISSEGEALANWRRKLHIQQLAADAGLAPRVAHMDEGQRAILSDFVVDRSFPAFYNNPLTHETALMQLGRMVRRIHGLPCRPRWR
jgi:aminoglycoside phosphotransferase